MYIDIDRDAVTRLNKAMHLLIHNLKLNVNVSDFVSKHTFIIIFAFTLRMHYSLSKIPQNVF